MRHVKRGIAALFVAFLGAGCSSGAAEDNLAVDNLIAENLVIENSEASDAVLASMRDDRPNYAFEEDGAYGYIAVVSENDRKDGKVAGNVHMFVYRGVSDGVYRIHSINDAGTHTGTYECRRPCTAIKANVYGSVSRIAFTPESIIGGAFDDAFNGRLRARAEPRDQRPAAAAEAPATSLWANDPQIVTWAGSAEDTPAANDATEDDELPSQE